MYQVYFRHVPTIVTSLILIIKYSFSFDVRTTFQDGRYSVSLVIPNPSRTPSRSDLLNFPDRARAKREESSGDGSNKRYRRMSREMRFTDENEASDTGNHKRIRRVTDETFPTLRVVPSASEIAETVGEYLFGLRTIYPPGYTESDPVLVRYSGEWFYEPTQRNGILVSCGLWVFNHACAVTQ